MVKRAVADLPTWAIIVFYGVGVAAIQMLAVQMTSEVGRLVCATMQFFLTGALLYGPVMMRKAVVDAGEQARKLKDPPQ